MQILTPRVCRFAVYRPCSCTWARTKDLFSEAQSQLLQLTLTSWGSWTWVSLESQPGNLQQASNGPQRSISRAANHHFPSPHLGPGIVNQQRCLPCLKWGHHSSMGALLWELAIVWENWDKIPMWTRSKSNYCLGMLPELIFEGENQVQHVSLDGLKGAVFLLNDVTDILLKLVKLVPQCSSSSKLMLLQFHYSTHQAAVVS